MASSSLGSSISSAFPPLQIDKAQCPLASTPPRSRPKIVRIPSHSSGDDTLNTSLSAHTRRCATKQACGVRVHVRIPLVARGAADAMDVGCRVLGAIKLHHPVDGWEVEATRRNVGREQARRRFL